MEFQIIIIRLLLSLISGSLIGLERTYHGRPAGLRTHALVCTSSSLLMLMTVAQWELFPSIPLETIQMDPTRMAQGIMTGIGFLGAGVIMKDKLSIRGLTTAASIWITASIGITIGVGLYLAAFITTLLALVVLGVFRGFEKIMPTQSYCRLTVRFRTTDTILKDDLYKIIGQYKLEGTQPSYELEKDGSIFKFQLTVRTTDPDNFQRLATELNQLQVISEFSIIPSE